MGAWYGSPVRAVKRRVDFNHMSEKNGRGKTERQEKYKIILVRYLAASAFFAVFALVYYRFSHEIRSPWMTWLFAWPLIMGAVPAVLEYLGILPGSGEESGDGEEIGGQQKDFYRFGIAALTSASLLRGILRIAGTDSTFVDYLFMAGAVMAAAGAVTYFLKVRRPDGKDS